MQKIINTFKNIISDIFGFWGYEIHKKKPVKVPGEEKEEPKLIQEFDYLPSTQNRPVGDINAFLLDIRERGFAGNYVFDIGANKTEWSRMIKKNFPDTDLYLVDPLVEMEEYMENFCKEFKGSDFNIIGVGSKSEKHILTINGEYFEGSTMMLDAIPSYLRSNKQREVEVTTIDRLIQDYNLKIPDMVKMDIQGFELEALKGSEKLFGKTELFIIEVSLFRFNKLTPDVTEVINFMNEKNYVIYDIPGFLRRPLDGALAQIDICFVKKDSFLRNSINWSSK